MARTLVLGGTGFIGSHIAKRLVSRGQTVRILARPASDRRLLEGWEVEWTEGDLERPGDLERALEGCDALVHAAAYYPVYSLDPEAHRRRGLAQVARIHEALARSEVRRFLYVSTLSAVGRYPDGRPEDEGAPWPAERGRSAYARVKRAMQQEVLHHADRFNTVLVAPTGVFGEGDRKPTTGRVIVDVAKGRIPVALKGFTNAVDVRAVAWGVAEALASGAAGRLYVLGGENLTLPELLGRIARLAGRRPPLIALPPRLLYPVSTLAEVVGMLARRPAPALPKVGLDFARYGTWLSSEVARRELGYEPPVPVDDALRRALAWFRGEKYL